MTRLLSAVAVFALLAAPTLAREEAPPGAVAYIVSPADGEVVTSPVKVQFGLKGIGVAPAGVEFPDTGHHHLLIDMDPPSNLNEPMPSDDPKLVHFGLGQTETVIELEPGTHTLQLMLGDFNHVPHDPPIMSSKITITVE